MIWPVYTVFKQINPQPVYHRDCRILETYLSADGPRTRIVDGLWTEAEALRHLEELNNKRDTR